MRDKYIFEPSELPKNKDAERLKSYVLIMSKIERIFSDDKSERKKEANNSQKKLEVKLQTLKDDYLQRKAKKGMTKSYMRSIEDEERGCIHDALHDYEKRYLMGGGDLSRCLNELKNLEWNVIEKETTAGNIELEWNGMVLGTVYRAEKRFKLLNPKGDEKAPKLFVRRGGLSPRQYVYLRNSSTFVRRYVTRGLSAYDGMNLSRGRCLKALLIEEGAQKSEIYSGSNPTRHLLKEKEPMSETDQVVSHTRGWGGAKRFISTGISNRRVFSTRGEPFLSGYGAVVIDLSKIDESKIIDLHRADLAQKKIGCSGLDLLKLGPLYRAQNHGGELYLALRDVIRTRELLIKGTVPIESICCASGGKRILGIGIKNKNNASKCRKYLREKQLGHKGLVSVDLHSMLDPDKDKYWCFILYENDVNCLTAEKTLKKTLPVPKNLNERCFYRFPKYKPTFPIGY